MTGVQHSEVEDFLAHYGVLGMKWGVRKDRRTGIPRGTPRAKGRKTQKELREIDRRKKAAKNRRTLSDSEIESRIKRLKMEKELKQLTDNDVSPGKVLVLRLLGDTGNQAWRMVLAAMAGGIALAVKTRFDKKADGPDFEFDYKDIPRYVAPNPNRKK